MSRFTALTASLALVFALGGCATEEKRTTIAVVGLGYVGLPLAVEFGKKFDVPIHVRSSFSDISGTMIIDEGESPDQPVCGATLALMDAGVKIRQPVAGVAMGLIVAIYGTTLVVSLAGDTFKLKEVLVLATILSIGSYGAFVMLLKLQFPVWPTFITG